MKPASYVDRQTDALARAQHHWQASHGIAPRTAALTIALTREAGTPGTSVARAVGARLGWPVYDHELVEQIARDMGLRVSLLESVDERQQSWLLEWAGALTSGPQVSEASYVRHLTETILSLGSHGRCVIVGRGAAHILPKERTLRVRLVGELEDRIAATGRLYHLSHDDAARRVEDTDRARRRFIKDHFQKDATEPGHYDLLLNSSRWSVAECADLIVHALHQLEAHVAGQGQSAS